MKFTLEKQISVFIKSLIAIFLLVCSQSSSAEMSKRLKRSPGCSTSEDCNNGGDCYVGECVHLLQRFNKAMGTCKGILKKSCTVQEECECNEMPLMCHEGECVKSRDTATKWCVSYKQCSGIQLCLNHTCQDATTFEQMQMFQSQVQTVEKRENTCEKHSDCKVGFYCHRSECVKERLPFVRLVLCLINNYHSVCYDDGDCKGCGKDYHLSCRTFSSDNTIDGTVKRCIYMTEDMKA